ncbi:MULTISPECIES: Ig-like domain-containing protein [Methylobacterium]|uniref:Bacterial Ig-like domain-containing protein n=7 Tax=Pseudomonadota TaxID=1224 RepID=A0ABQ4STQ7_9HYPH|nr:MULTISPECIES: Ig-like domain-containing protein [Methylobacterium]GBU18865.1 hypothetical protein AwMethylo_30800 [Methylobacterium sp.]GJE06472.1 hypothetical protein AOPFMNJM_1792 [Methylobacterium jeotgali]
MAVTATLTPNADTVLPSDEDQIVYATALTFNPSDSLEGGAGFDTLALSGSGTFDLGSPLRFTGFEAVTLTNETTAAATLRLGNSSTAVTLGRGASTATTDANGNALVNVFLGTGSNSIIGGVEKDAFYVASPSNIRAGDSISGGGGGDTLILSGPGRFGGYRYDLTNVSLTGIPNLYVSAPNMGATTVRVSSTTLQDFSSINGGYSMLASVRIFTSDSNLFIGNLTVGLPGTVYQSLSLFTTDNAAGTTFHVGGATQAGYVSGGVGPDALISETVLAFAARENILSRSIESVTDPSGTYQRLVSISTTDRGLNTSTTTISGRVDASARGVVSIYEGSTLVGTGTINADRTWTANVSLQNDGTHTLSAQAQDGAGNIGTSNPVRLTLDTSPPVVTISTAGSDVVDRYVTLSGSAVTQTAGGINQYGEVGATITVYEGSTALGSATVDGQGRWSLGVTLAGPGNHALVAVETDVGGNVGRSNTVVFNALPADPGNNTYGVGAGTHVLDAGAGDDTVVFGFALPEARLSYDAAGHTVIDGPNGTHAVLSGFEHYRFADGTVNQQTGSALVDDLFYYVRNLDVWNARVDAETHYNANGWQEGRDPSAYFSTSGYLAANGDVKAAGINPLTHYDTNGWREGRDPSATFDNELYLARNPDVKAAGIDPLSHFLANGQAEGRQAYAAIGRPGDVSAAHGFDAEFYLLSNPDVARAALGAGGDAFAFAASHYQQHGWHEGRNPNAVFDTKGYLAAYADVRAANVDPLLHYDTNGWREGRDPSAAFDTRAYEATYGDVAAANVNPLTHYLTNGALEGRSAFADGHFG